MQKTFSIKESKKIGETLGVIWDKFDVEQFRKGLEVELEHELIDPKTNVTDDNPFIYRKNCACTSE